MTDLVFSQLTDLFRIGFIIGLVFMMYRTAAVTGRVLPLLFGVVVVAVILPATMPGTATFTEAFLFGLVSNSIILVHVLIISRLIARVRR